MGYAFGVGREAPAFKRTAIDGTSVSLGSFRGDWNLIVVFVPESCGRALIHLRELDMAAGRLWGLRGQLLGICLANAAPDAEEASGSPPSFPMLMDDGSLAAAYGVSLAAVLPTPTAFIIDRAGKIVWTGEGSDAVDPAVLERALRDVVR